MSKETNERTASRSVRGRCAQVVATLAATGALTGAMAGTASAHEVQPVGPTAGGPVGAAEESAGALDKHMEMYHFSQPTWEVQSLITDPKQNFEIHHQLIDNMVDPFVGLLP